MKKNYILTLLFSFLFAFSFQAQVVVGEGTTVNEEMPIEPFYKFSYSQVIYLATEINASGTITGLKYTATEETDLENSDGWDIYIGHTSLNAHGTEFVDISELTQVFSGNVTIANQVVSITLDTSFDYNGTDNLMVAVNETSNVNNSYDSSSHDFYCTTTTGVNRGLVYYTDSQTIGPIDPSNPPTVTSGNNRQSYANITFEGITQSCENPTAIVVDNIMANTADVSWTSSGSSWEYIVLTAADDPPGESDSGTAVSTASVSLSGLTEVTDYVFYVRNVCSGENSGWAAGYFRTGCADLFTLPFNEGFNNGGDPPTYAIPATMPDPSTTEECWTILDESPAEAPSNSSWGMNYWGSGTYEGDNSAVLYTDYNQGKNDDYLISPRLDLTGNDRLRFRAKSYNVATENNSMEVLMSNTDMDSEDFTIVLSEVYEYPGDEWAEVFVDLSAYTGAHYIAFHVPPTDVEGFQMFVDEVVIEQIPTCDYPINVTISNLTSTSADASWDAGMSGEIEWEYEVLDAGEAAPTGSGTAVTTNSVTLTGLTQGSSYDFYVRASCGAGDFSTYTPLNGATFMIPPIGGVCTDPIVVTSLPYNTTDDTANYQDDYDGSAGSNCGESASYYLNGDDVVYSYTPASDTSINVSMTPVASYSGIFVYDSCDDIGTECVAGIGVSNTDERVFDMNVYAGTTYYIVISTWASPQSTGYDLTITENTCSDPVITVTVNACDSATDEYTVDVDITDMGSSAQYTVSDDLGNVQYAQAAGVLTFTFTGTQSHIITVEGDDANCNQTYTVISACQACHASGINCTLGDGFVGLVIGDIDNSGSGCSDDGYGNFTTMTTDLAQGETYDLTITTGYSNQYIRVWIDLNDDYVFDTNSDELILDNHLIASVGTEVIPVTIPSNANLGSHVMRAKANWNSIVPDDACEATSYGETEDYTVAIVESLGINDLELADLRIYPNPVDGNYITIKSPINGDKYVKLFDINGRRVLSTTITGDILDISSINNGFYMVEITINGYTNISKLIIQ